jgi:type 1 glutamine amidotransferase
MRAPVALICLSLMLALNLGFGAPACSDGSDRYLAKVHGDGAAGTSGANGGAAGSEPGGGPGGEGGSDPGGGGAAGSGTGGDVGGGGMAGGGGGRGGSGSGSGGTAGGAGGTPGGMAGRPGGTPDAGPGGMAGRPGGTPDASTGPAPPPDAATQPGGGGPFQMLVLSKALEYRHGSIGVCQQMLRDLGATPDASLPMGALPGSQFTVTIAREDLTEFTDEGLKPYAIIFWCNPTGTVFTSGGANGATGKAAIQKYLTSGGAWGGVHSATDFENTQGWPWFQDQVNGGNFAAHDADGTPNSIVWQPGPLAMDHPVIRGIRSPWSCADEWYRLNRNPENVPGFVVLGKLGTDQRPAVYVRDIPGGGRSFYTIRGHNSSVFAEPNFRKLVHQGVLWAVRRMR